MPHLTGTPGQRPHREHRFSVARNPALLRSSVKVVAQPLAVGGIRLTLEPAAVGHAVPTGDLFRRLEVSAELVGAEMQVLGQKARYLSRHFAETVGPGGVLLRSVVQDDRVGAAGGAQATSVEFSFEAAEAVRIEWRVAYQRVEHPRSERDEQALVADEVTIASGSMPLPRVSP